MLLKGGSESVGSDEHTRYREDRNQDALVCARCRDS
jgi:hypothetical protein